MYERSDMLQFKKMLSAGLFPRGKDFVDVKTFRLEDWKEAFDVADTHTGVLPSPKGSPPGIQIEG